MQVRRERCKWTDMAPKTGAHEAQAKPEATWVDVISGILAARLDRPDLLELETKHVMLMTLAALIDDHDGIADWIPHDRDPSVRILDPREHAGLPVIVTPFVMETEAAWKAVEGGAVIDHAFIATAATAQALRLELTQGPARAS